MSWCVSEGRSDESTEGAVNWSHLLKKIAIIVNVDLIHIVHADMLL